MTSQPQRGPWVRRHPILTVLWLIVAAIWLAAIIAVYDDDPGVSIFAFLVPIILVTAIIFGLGILSDRVRLGRGDDSSAPSPIPDQSRSSSHRLAPDTTSLQRKLDDENRQQRDLALRLGQREAELGRREADLQLREALLLSKSQEQPQSVSRPLSTPESKPSFDPAIIHPDRLPDQTAPARFCFNCGAWFARDDDTCRLCGAWRVGSEA